MKRQLFAGGTMAEDAAGFSEAVRCGDHVFVSGMNASDGSGGDAELGDAADQAAVTLSKIEAVLERAASSLDHVVRTRVFLRDPGDAQAVARVHLGVFGAVRPANSFLVAAPIGDNILVEIEAQALVSPGQP